MVRRQWVARFGIGAGILALFVVSLSGTADQASATIVAEDIVHHWAFEEGSGTVADDRFSYIGDGSLRDGAGDRGGTVAFSTDAKVGSYAMDFTGGVVNVSGVAGFYTEDFTFSAWVKARSMGGGGYGRIVADRNALQRLGDARRREYGRPRRRSEYDRSPGVRDDQRSAHGLPAGRVLAERVPARHDDGQPGGRRPAHDVDLSQRPVDGDGDGRVGGSGFLVLRPGEQRGLLGRQQPLVRRTSGRSRDFQPRTFGRGSRRFLHEYERQRRRFRGARPGRPVGRNGSGRLRYESPPVVEGGCRHE